MKYYLSRLLLFFFLISSFSQIKGQTNNLKSFKSSANDSLVHNHIKYLYKRDALSLALKDIEKDVIEVPDSLITNYYKGLIGIYNAKPIIYRDSILEIHNDNVDEIFHEQLQSIYLMIENGTPWAKYWFDNKDTTSVVWLNELLEKYQFEVQKTGWGAGTRTIFTLRTKLFINVIAIKQRILELKGTKYSAAAIMYLPIPFIEISRYGSIEAKDLDDHIRYEFSYYNPKNNKKKYWIYNSYETGLVEFIDTGTLQ